MKPLTPDAALAAVVGKSPSAPHRNRQQTVGLHRGNNLQDAANSNVTLMPNSSLFFGKDQVTMFELAGLIGKHVTK